MKPSALSIFSSASDIMFLPSVPVDRKALKTLPETSGVYFVVDKSNKILYIGKSVNLRQRWIFHHRFHMANQISECRVFFFETPKDVSIDSLEESLIDIFRPEWNGKEIDKEHLPRHLKSDVLVARVSPKVKKLAEMMAKMENRNLSNFIETLILEKARKAGLIKDDERP